MTIRDVNDGFGGAGACRECTLPRDEDYSVPVGWIRGHAKLGTLAQYVKSESRIVWNNMD